jgi:protein TonB
MAHYRGTAQGPDKAKAIAAVLLIHAALGAALLTGLNVDTVTRSVERIQIFDIAPDKPPPPPPPPPPESKPSAPAKLEQGAAGKKAEPSPIVLPKPRVELPAKPPIAAAPIAGSGSAPTSGAAASGTGVGAGGEGSGRGGGGTGISGPAYSKYTTANTAGWSPQAAEGTGPLGSRLRSTRTGVPQTAGLSGRAAIPALTG